MISGKRVLAVDVSGSTNQSSTYWRRVKSLLQHEEYDLYYFWNENVISTNKVGMQQAVCRMLGNGGTEPQCIVPYIKSLNSPAHLTLVTDGLVETNDVRYTDCLIGDMKFESVRVCIYGDQNLDLSVAAPFVRSSPYEIIHNDTVLSASASDVLELKSFYNNPGGFLENAAQLAQEITARNLGRENAALRTQILDLQKNLLAHIRCANAFDDNALTQIIRSGEFDQTRFAAGVEFVRSSLGAQTSAADVETWCQRMVAACDGTGGFGFDRLAPTRLQRAPTMDVETAPAPVPEMLQSTFECPIMLDADMPAILIAAGAPVFEGVEKAVQESILTCPLALLNHPALIGKVIARIDSPVGLQAACRLFQSAGPTSPYTRAPLSSFLTFGDHESHNRACDAAIANLMFGGKIAGQRELWLSVLFLIARRVHWITQEVSVAFEAALVRRLETQKTAITLSGLAVEPMITATVGVAVWYCVASEWLFRDGERNRLRALVWVVPHMLEILKILRYTYPATDVARAVEKYQLFARMMKSEQTDGYYRDCVRATYQNYVIINGKHVFLDGDVQKGWAEMFVETKGVLTLSDIHALNALVDRQKKMGAILIPQQLPATEIPAAKVNYGYPLRANISSPLPICPKTMRPYSTDRRTGSEWRVAAEAEYGPLSGQLSCKALLIECVQKMGRYPSKEEYILFCAEREANKAQPRDTLPFQMLEFTDYLFEDYREVMQMVSAAEFIRLSQASVNMAQRKIIESN